jgi:hypothetical protein
MAYYRGLKLINDNLKKGVWKFQICQFMDIIIWSVLNRQ